MALAPDIAEAWLGRGTILAELKRCDEAFSAYDKALALKPDLAEAWVGHGNVSTDLRRFDEAFAAYEKALELAKTIEPEFQIRSLPGIKERLQSLAAGN